MSPSVLPIEERLLSVVDDLFTAFESDSLHMMTSHWAQLEEEIKIPSPIDSLQSDALVVDVAFCIERLCDTFMSLVHIDNSFKQRVSELVPTPVDDDLSAPDSPPAKQPSYVKPASEWLLKNLHNPFPSAELRGQLSTAHDSPRKNIDTWFNEARKRIGWNAIRKRHYNSRKEMVDAASSFFLDHVISREHDNEFLEMEEKAKDLYSKRIATSELMQKLDRSVKTMSEDVKRQADEEKRERQLERRRVSYKRDSKSAAPLTIDMAGKKRRLRNEDEEQPSKKRSRSHHDEDEDDNDTSPSRSSSRRASSLFSEAATESTSTTEASPPPCTGKRRASDSSHDRPQKRPRMSSAPPMTLPAFPVYDWFRQTPSPPQLLTDAECSYDISSWQASMDSLSDGDSSGVTTPTDFPSIIPLPDINQVNAILELDASTTATCSLLPTVSTNLFDDLCSPLQTTLPGYDYTLPDPFNFDFDSNILGLDTSNTSLGSWEPVFSVGVGT